MNRVGNQGRGESVWLAFFLYDVLTRFAQLARAHHEPGFARRCSARRGNCSKTSSNTLGTVNGIAAPISTTANCSAPASIRNVRSIPCRRVGGDQWCRRSDRARQALQSVDQRLIDRDAGLMRLFAPPFDKSPLNPVTSKVTAPACGRWRSIHPRRDLGCHGLCAQRRQRTRVGTFRIAQPDPSRPDTAANRHLPSGALRRRG